MEDTDKPNKAGAPSLFKEEYTQQMLDYFSPYMVSTTKEIVGSQGSTREVPKEIPSLEKFGWKIQHCTATLYNWAHQVDEDGNLLHPDFLAAYSLCKEVAKHYYKDIGARGIGGSPTINLIMKNEHDYKDKSEVENTIKGGFLSNLSKLADEAEKGNVPLDDEE